MAGEHLAILGFGQMLPQSLNLDLGAGGSDLDLDGVTDQMPIGARVSNPAHLESVQYFYFPTPHWGIGISAGAVQLESKMTIALNNRRFSSGTTSNFTNGGNTGNASITGAGFEFIPAVRYTMRPHRRANPYLLAGIGLNHLSLRSNLAYILRMGNNAPIGGDYARAKSSIGWAATIGAGLQASIKSKWLVGTEARWTYLQIDKSAFGDSSWQTASACVWLGYKWSAPL